MAHDSLFVFKNKNSLLQGNERTKLQSQGGVLGLFCGGGGGLMISFLEKTRSEQIAVS